MEADHQSPTSVSSEAKPLRHNPRKRLGGPLDDELARLPKVLSGLSIHKSAHHGEGTAKPESMDYTSKPASNTSTFSAGLRPTRSISQSDRMTIKSYGAPQSSPVQQRKRVKLENSFIEAFKPDDRLIRILGTGPKYARQMRRPRTKPVSQFVPSRRPSLIEMNGCNLHPSSGSRLPDPPASLDGLPTELKLMVLGELHDMQSLEALVRASALYSRAYFDRREEIFNKQTFKELRRRGIRLLPPPVPLRSLAWLDVSIIGGGPPPPDLGPALYSFYNRFPTRRHPKAPRLSIDHCQALLTITDIVGWKTWTEPVYQNGPKFTFDTFYLSENPEQAVHCPPDEVLKAYSRGLAHYHPIVFNVPGEPSFTLAQAGIFREIFSLIMQRVLVFGPFPMSQTAASVLNRSVSETQLAAAMALSGKFGAFAHGAKV